jgi:Uncharacterized conserved protein
MTVLDIGIFAASPSEHVSVSDHVDRELQRFCEIWPHVTVRCRHYLAPADVLGFVALAGETAPVEERRPVVAGAAARDPEVAATIFCAELVERAACAWYEGDTTRRSCSALELLADGQSVFDCAGYIGTPLKETCWDFVPFDLHQTYDWIAGEDLATASPVWLPLALVAPSVPSDRRFCEMTTIGCAADGDLEVATSRCLRELYERHALRIAWFLNQPFNEVEAPASWTALADADLRTGWKTRFYHLPLGPSGDLVVVYSRHNTENIFSIGSSCSANWGEAAGHAVREAIQGKLVAWLYRNVAHTLTTVKSYPDHTFWYSQPATIACVDRFFDRSHSWHAAGSGTPGQKDAGPSFTNWFDDPAAVRSTCIRLQLLDEPDIKVVRLLSPSFQPLEARHDAARLVGSWRDGLSPEDLQTAPHPFP